MTAIDQDFIKKYIEGAEKNQDYLDRVAECTKIKIHSVDKPDQLMLKKYQPSEPDWAIAYKTENWRAITKAYFEKVESMISKIFRASDFVIKFEESGSAANGETLQDYTTTDFPRTKSLLYYIQKIWMRQYLVEPNGVTLIAPINPNKRTSDYWKPFFTQVASEKVLYFDGNFILIKETDTQWTVIDTNDFLTITKSDKKYQVEVTFSHNLGYVPASYNGGKICLTNSGDFYYESVVSGVCPWWSQALMEECDKNVAIKQHMHPEKAVYGENKCKTCDGNGKISQSIGYEKSMRTVKCGDCEGSGIATALTSGFGLHVVRPPRGGETPPPDWAPGKYITKDISPLEFLDADIDKRIIQGLAAVCMEQLAEETQTYRESGIKKSYDWEQTNIFLYSIAIDICQYKLPWMYRVISDYRYGNIGQGMDEKAIDEMQPQINTPQRFDIVGVNDLKGQIAELKKEQVSPDIINELEKQLVGKEFAGDQDTINYLLSVIEIDPLRNYIVDDKALLYSSGAINLIDYAVSSNIQTLVQKAATDPSFYNLPLNAKRQKVYDIAKSEGIGQKPVTIPLNASSGSKADAGSAYPING